MDHLKTGLYMYIPENLYIFLRRKISKIFIQNRICEPKFQIIWTFENQECNFMHYLTIFLKEKIDKKFILQ